MKGVTTIPFYGNDAKIINSIVMASKTMKEPEIAREFLFLWFGCLSGTVCRSSFIDKLKYPIQASICLRFRLPFYNKPFFLSSPGSNARVFLNERLKINKKAIVAEGLLIEFETRPELYEDRKVANSLDLKNDRP